MNFGIFLSFHEWLFFFQKIKSNRNIRFSTGPLIQRSQYFFHQPNWSSHFSIWFKNQSPKSIIFYAKRWTLSNTKFHPFICHRKWLGTNILKAKNIDRNWCLEILFQIYLNTKGYMSDHIVQPVLKRANSVKQIGSVASSYATDRIDGALDVADQYVDKYLPSEDATDSMITEKKSFQLTFWDCLPFLT